MCAIFGFVNYGGKVKYSKLKKLVKELSIASEVRGTDATGISYVKDGVVKVFKKPKSAHQLDLYFPTDTKVLIGHTRFTTQGSEKLNQNNHPFVSMDGFSLAHNGVIYNDKELRTQYQLPPTNIETDSYVAVQLLDCFNQLDFNSIKFMAEQLEGSFAISILNHDNTLYLVKESNPIYLVHFRDLGLYLYSSTKEIMAEALSKCSITYKYDVITVNCNDILKIDSMGEICKSTFKPCDEFDYFNSYYTYDELDILLEYCENIGIDEDDVYTMLDFGLEVEEIEYIVNDEKLLKETLETIRNIGGSNYDYY